MRRAIRDGWRYDLVPQLLDILVSTGEERLVDGTDKKIVQQVQALDFGDSSGRRLCLGLSGQGLHRRPTARLEVPKRQAGEESSDPTPGDERGTGSPAGGADSEEGSSTSTDAMPSPPGTGSAVPEPPGA